MAEKDDLQAGTGYAILTPPIGIELGGYGYYLSRKATLIRRNLYARALVLAQGDTRIAVVVCDLLALSAEVVAQARNYIASMTRVPRDNVLISCTNTHSAPATLWMHGCGEPDASYVSLLPRLIASAVVEAEQDLEPARMAVGSADLPGFALNRVDPMGAVDSKVHVLEILQTNSDQRNAIFSFGCHPVSTPPEDTEIHTDFPGSAVHILESMPDYEFAMFLPGSFGDINPVTAHTNPKEIRRAARMLAGASLVAMGQAKEVESLRPLRCVERNIELPLAPQTVASLRQRRKDNLALMAERDAASPAGKAAKFWAEACDGMLYGMTGEPDPWMEILRNAQGDIVRKTGRDPRLHELAAVMDLPPDSVVRLLEMQQTSSETILPTTQSCLVQIIQVGDIAIMAHPTELFAGLGLEIRRRSPFVHTFVVGCANGYLGFLPDEAEYERHGYAAETVPYMLEQFPFAPSVGKTFVDSCVKLLEEVSSGSTE